MATRPTTWPHLEYGEGSWAYDEPRAKIVLRHRYKGRAFTERAETCDECIARRNRRRRDADVRETLSGDGTLGGLLTAWLASRRDGRKAGTIETYEWSMSHLLAQLGVDTLVTDLTVTDVEVMYQTLLANGLTKSSLGKIRSHLKMALDFGVRRNLVPLLVREELRMAELPPMAPGKKVKRWFNLADFEIVRKHFLENRTPRNTLFMVMLLCGLRPGEALGLKWEHVDLIGRTLRVEGHMERHSADGETWSPVLKTDHLHHFAHRSVPIPGDLVLVLAEMERSATSPMVFIEGDDTRIRGRHMRSDALHRHALVVASEARVPYVHPNGYRHTFASVCRHHGMPYEQLAKLLGHKDATMIIQTYGHPIVNTSPVDLDRYLGSGE